MSSPNTSADCVAVHPYYPQDTIRDNYVANTLSVPTLLVSFAIGVVAILYSTKATARNRRPSMSSSDMYAAMWFVLCGFIHLFFEGTARHVTPFTYVG
jgi:cholestenol delta-isomerase